MPEYKNKIRDKLILTFVLFVVIIIGTSGWFLYELTRRSLDEELGSKLAAIAQVASVQISGELITTLRRGEEESRYYNSVRNRLQRIIKETGVKRLYVFDKSNNSLVDTEENVRIGSEYVRLLFNKSELEQVWNGFSTHTVLFQDDAGEFYKSGFAPIKVGDKVVAAVGVDTGVLFMDTIRDFRGSVLVFVIISVVITVAIGFVFAKGIVRPINKLVSAAEEIGKGNFAREVKIGSRDEFALLAKSMDDMRKGIIDRDNRLKLMLASVAHEIRNPLGSIEIFTGLMADELSPDDEKRTYLEKIIKEIGNLKWIINEFLVYARPPNLVKETVHINEVLEDVCLLVSPEIEDKGISLHKELRARDTVILADAEQVKRALINILKNSTQATPPGGRITVKDTTKDGKVIIHVSDTGTGIPDENLERLFEPFFTTKEKGMGLGLSIVKKIVEENGGRIEVDSEVGKYAAFSISFPVASKRP